MCWHGIIVCKLRNLSDAFVALMGKNQAEKNTIKQNLNIVKAYREEGKNKEK